MKRFFSIIKLVLRVKISFTEPKENKLIVFDDESIEYLKPVIPLKKYFVMKNRVDNINKIYLSLGIFKRFIKNYNGNIMTAYLLSLIEIIRPKVIITFIDNSIKFSDLAKLLHKEIKFIAIHNAYRFGIIENDYLFKKKLIKTNLNKRLFIPKLLVYGKCDIDIFKKYKIKVNEFLNVGCLRLANAMNYLTKNKIKIKKNRYDVCVISDTTWLAHFLNFKREHANSGKYLEEGTALMVKHTINYCLSHKKKFIFVLKNKKNDLRRQNQELNFYKKYLSKKEFDFLKSNSNKNQTSLFASYAIMLRSKVVIGTISTMLGENLALGRKILACNFSRIKILDFPVKGICFINNQSYQVFEKRLSYILNLSKKNYLQKLNKSKNYIVNYDKQISTIKLIKFQISKAIKN